MRHLVKGKKFGRTSTHRKATFTALAVALIHERRIKTTVAKAKELRRFVEPLITRAKVDSTHNRRMVFSKLQDKYAVTELFEEIGPLAKDRPGGYTRVLKLGFRTGDAAELAMIELVDYNDVPPEEAEGKTKRTRRAGKSKKTAPAVTEQDVKKAEEPKGDESKPELKKSAEGDEQSAVSSGQGKAHGKKESADVEPVEKSTDFTVAEVKKKFEDMSVEEAMAFIADDERVTVQKALNKKTETSSGENK